ncbi:MAG: helix-turn-helix domain-containing protein [Clostridia bacterium]|nr:helix-turn-helix domain-containing protein [Clostridia bacterium]
MNNFADFLYTLRKEKGMTQAELAELLGVTNKAVSKWETGEAMPETSLLLPLSRILGVSVDELLAGKRDSQDDIASREDKIKDEDKDDDVIEEYIKSHLFKRGKDDEKTLLDKISALVCTCIFSIGLLTYLILGAVGDLWTPYWIIIPLCALSCGIIGILFDIFNKAKRAQKIKRGENPYIGAICGIVMITCIITYLILGVFFSLWHPFWILLVAGAFVCSVAGIIGGIVSNKTKLD